MTDQSQPLAQGASFLIVEDDMLIVTMMELVLNESGARSISVATSVTGAFSLIESNTYDVAIFDRQLRDGVSFPAAITAQEKGAAIIIATGMQSFDLPDKLSGSIVLRKPFKLPEFESAVRLALNRH
jgi:DNA-binding response OmpR family regulator